MPGSALLWVPILPCSLPEVLIPTVAHFGVDPIRAKGRIVVVTNINGFPLWTPEGSRLLVPALHRLA
jgi:hypothetical protein